jgi:hypothetical protein
MWKKIRIRFFDFIEIFDEINPPWTIETRVFRRIKLKKFRKSAAFWFIMTFWTFFILQMAYGVMWYIGVDFVVKDENTPLTFINIFIYAHSFSLYICAAVVPLCLLICMIPKKEFNIYRVFPSSVIKRMPQFYHMFRKRDIIDDCIVIENRVNLWWWI